MNKLILFLIIALFTATITYSQPVGFEPLGGWAKTYGGAAKDVAFDIAFDQMGTNYVMGGQTMSNGDPLGDAWLIKFDYYLNDTDWTVTYSSPFEDAFNTVVSYEVPMKSYGGNVIGGGYAGNGSDRDMLIVDYNSNGFLWNEFAFDFGFGDDEINHIFKDDPWDSYGYFTGYATSASGYKDLIVAKYDVYSLDTIQTWTLGGAYNDIGYTYVTGSGLLSKTVGNGKIVGASQSALGDFDIYIANFDWYQTMLMKDTTYINPAGDEVIFDAAYNQFNSMFYLVGYTTSFNGNKDVLVVKMDEAGNIIWSKNYGNPYADDEATGINILTDYDGFIYISGYTTSPNGDKDAYYLEIDGEGEIRNELSFGDTGDDVAYGIAGHNCANFLAGMTTSGSEDLYFLKVPTISYTISSMDITCYGYGNGYGLVEVQGGSGYYNVTWTDSMGNYYGNIMEIDWLSQSTYSVVISDVSHNICSYYESVTISEPSYLGANPESYNVSCYNVCDGWIIMNAYGGTPPYTYYWGDGQTSDTAFNLCEGSYYPTIKDANYCQFDPEINVYSPYNPGLWFDNIAHNNCFGECNGSASLMNTEQLYWPDILWTTGDTTLTVSNLCAGIYGVSVQDMEMGCSYYELEILQHDEIVIDITGTNITCFGGADGSAVATVTGGTGTYLFSWSDLPASSTSTITGLSANVFYYVTVTDNNGCVLIDSIMLSQPEQLIVNISASNDVSCYGDNDGNATASVSGGIIPYTYIWDINGTTQTTQVAVGLSAGSYNVGVVDNYGCFATNNIVIDQPDSLQMGITVVDALCNGSSNGSATANISGGISPYSYLWSNGNSTAGISALAAGTYYLFAHDANGCSATDQAVVGEPALLALDYTATAANCGANDGSAVINSTTGGTSPYVIDWNDGQSGTSASNLFAGNINLTMTDNNNCIQDFVVTIPTQGAGTASTTTEQILCNGLFGTATASMTGGISPFNYTWSNGQAGATAVMLSAGTYTVTITDAVGCEGIADAIIDNAPSQINLYTTSSGAGCLGCDGTASAFVSGGTTPYSFTWSNNTTDATTTGLCGDAAYFVTVVDANECQSSSGTYIATESAPQLTGTVKYQNQFFASGDVTIQLYTATDISIELQLAAYVNNQTGGGFTFTDLQPGTYYLRVAINNNAAHPGLVNTYYANTYSWDAATPLFMDCGTNLNINVNMYEVQPAGGAGIISGTITYSENSLKEAGDPVPGAEIYLEQEPYDEPIVSTESDTSGHYELRDIPYGVGYSMVVDIPGYPLLSTFTNLSLDQNSGELEGLNFFVDSSETTGGIFIDSLSTVSEIDFEDFSLHILPNPFKDQLTIEYILKKQGYVSIEIFDATGKRMIGLVETKQNEGFYSVVYYAEKTRSGVYYMKFSVDKTYYFTPIMKLR